MEHLFVQLAQVRNLPRTLALCTLLLGLPCLAIGFQADDYVLAQRAPSHPFDAFSFFPGGEGTAELRQRGILNWSTSHEARLQLLRPLASLSHALDFALWPEAAWFMHLQNVVLYAALVWTAARVFAEVLGPGLPASLAALFYALQPGHGTSAGWIASRNTLLCALLGLMSVWHFVRASRAGNRQSLAALGLHALALLAGEAALAVLAPLFAYTLTLAVGPWRARALTLSPHLVLCIGYVVVYAKLGYGSSHSGMYLNVLQQPWAVVHNFAIAVPLYLASQALVPFAGLAGLVSDATLWVLAVLCLCLLAAFAPFVMVMLRRDPRARFFGLSALASIAPLSAVTPQDRLAFWVGFGGAGLLALGLTANDRALQVRRGSRALLHLHTSGALFAFVPMCFVCTSPAVGGLPRAVSSALVAPEGRDVVLLNVPVESTIMSVLSMRQTRGIALPRSLRALYVGGASYTVRRVDERTIDMHVDRGWFSNALERITRDPDAEPFAPGNVETTDAFSARIMQTDERGAPTLVRFELIRPLEDARWLWLHIDGPRVLPWTPPRIGETQHLPAAGLLW